MFGSTNRPRRLTAPRRPLAGLIVLAILSLGLILAQAAAARDFELFYRPYNITQLTKGDYGNDRYPTINNRGQVVWFHLGCQVQVDDDPPAYVTEEGRYKFYQPYGKIGIAPNIPKNSTYYMNYFSAPPLLLNDNGQLGYHLPDSNGVYNIFFNDGISAAPQQLTNTSGQEWSLQLNQQGQMVWYAYDSNNVWQVYLFKNGAVSPITAYNYGSGSLFGYFSGLFLNDTGQVVWVDRSWDVNNSTYQYNIQLYQDGVTNCLYSTNNLMYSSKINNQGLIVWSQQSGGSENIMLYNGGSVQQISLPEVGTNMWPKINNKGQVIWQGRNINTEELNIYLYSQGKVTQVTNYQNDGTYRGIIDIYQNTYTTGNDQTKFSPYLNNNGEIVWVTTVAQDPNNTSGPYDYAVHVYNHNRRRTATVDRWAAIPSYQQGPNHAQINDAGQVTWSRWGGYDNEIYLATPVRSLDHLGHLLLSD